MEKEGVVMDPVLLLTATVNVNASGALVVKDSEMRMRQYSQSLSWWLKTNAFSRVVVCENSGFDWAHLHDDVAVRDFEMQGGILEYLTFVPDNLDEIRARGKGLGEMGIIKHALVSSVLMQNAGVIAKVTGRLQLKNVIDIVSCINGAWPSVLANYSMRLNNCDSRFFCADVEFIKRYLLCREGELDDRDGRYMEKILMRAILSAMADGRKVQLPIAAPWFEGISGSMGRGYGYPYREQFNLWLKRKILKW